MKRKPKRIQREPLTEPARTIFVNALDDAEQSLIAAHAELQVRQREHEIAIVHRDATLHEIATLRAKGLLGEV